MKVQELMELVNLTEVFRTLDEVRDYLLKEKKLEPAIQESFIEPGPFSLNASDIYQCEDGQVEIHGVLRILDEDKAYFLKECEASEYNMKYDNRELPPLFPSELPEDDPIADTKSLDYKNYREKCGIIDPVYLEEIADAYYEGAVWMKKYITNTIYDWLRMKINNYISRDGLNTEKLINDLKDRLKPVEIKSDEK